MVGDHELSEADERRRYFRVEDEVLLDFQVVPADRVEALRQRLACPLPEPFSLTAEFNQIRQDTIILRRSVQNESTAMARYLTALDRKLDRIAEVLMVQAMGVTEQMLCRVNIGAQGMSFSGSTALAKGTVLDMRIVLLSSSTGVRTLAQVRRSTPAPSGGFRVAVEFDHVREAERELLVQHVLKRQAEHLRRTRLEQDD